MTAQRTPPAAAPPALLPPAFLAQVAQTATGRGAAWDAVADVLSPPDAALVERLRSGALTTIWREGSRWLGDDTHMLTAELMSLDVYARGAVRRDPATDLTDLRAGHEAHVADQRSLVPAVRELADLCRAEGAAWADGRVDHAKALRASQHEFVENHLVTAANGAGLPDVAGRLACEADANVWRLLGRLMLAILTAETGKDFQRAVLGEGGGRPRRR